MVIISLAVDAYGRARIMTVDFEYCSELEVSRRKALIYFQFVGSLGWYLNIYYLFRPHLSHAHTCCQKLKITSQAKI
jgi:hypothetical protein